MFPHLHQSRPELEASNAALRDLAAALRRDVEVLATDIRPRGTHAPDRYQLAQRFLTSALERTGYRVEAQSFTAMGVACSNLIATLNGAKHPERILPRRR